MEELKKAEAKIKIEKNPEIDKDCRAIKKEFLDKLQCKDYKPKTKGKDNICLYPFVELVKKHPEQLVLCFRGNCSTEKVCIYRNNHAMFTFTSGTLYFNPNYLRYCPEWEKKLEKLVNDYGFNNGDIPKLEPVKRTENKRTGKMNYSTGFKNNKLSRSINEQLFAKNKKEDKTNLEKLYEFLSEVFDDYFDDEHKSDCFLEWGLKNKNFEEDALFTEKDLKKYIEDGKSNKKSKCEKEMQQQLFSVLKEQQDGYYVYDLEFQQKHENWEAQEKDRVAGISNKPDMLAIKFSDGKPQALVFIEVKSTREACNDKKSGVQKHIECTEKYPKSLLPVRCKEAFLIMHQYSELGLIKEFTWDKELKDNGTLPLISTLEKVIIFTGEAKKWRKDKGKDLLPNEKDDIPILLNKDNSGILVVYKTEKLNLKVGDIWPQETTN